MSKKLMWGALMAIAFASCTQEDVQNYANGLKSLSASVENFADNSRVGFADHTAAFFWTKGDQIGVTTSSSQTFQGMTLDGEGGEATGTFTGNFNGTPSGYAVYPYGEQGRHSLADGTLTYNLPSAYTYTTLDTEYAKANGNSHNAPMWGSITNGSVAFKHLGGVIAFSVGSLPENASDMQFVLKATNQISGSFTTTLTGSEPVIAAASTNVESDKQVTINFSTAEGQTSGYFYVPVPTGSLGNLSLAIYNGDTEIATGAWDNITINRKDIKRATLGEQHMTGGMVQEVTGINDITDELLTSDKNDLTIQITEEVTGSDNTITIPTSLQTEVTVFSFASVADDATITIENATDASYTGQIIIEVPENETIPTVNANIPDGEVYIKQGTVTTLVVSSADNTTIIGANAKVGTLTVNKGNVRIEAGGVVEAIENNTDGTLYIIDAGGTLPTTLSDDIIVVKDAAKASITLNGKVSADNFADLMSYGKDVLNTTELLFTLSAGQYAEVVKVTGGKRITIQPETTGSEVVIAGIDHQSNANPSTIVVNNITINNTLQTEGWFTGTAQNIMPCVGAWGGYFTFNNCKFIVSGESKAETGVMTWWTGENDMSMKFDGCTFDGNNNHSNARGMQIYGHVDLTVENCTFNTYKDYSLKYVGGEGHTAVFNNNKAYNTENFVELGSSTYPGKNYIVKFTGSTLGEGIANYVIANEEGQTVYIDEVKVWPVVHYEEDGEGNLVVYTTQGLSEALAKAVAANTGNTTIKLNSNLDMTGIEWTPVYLNGQQGVDIVTVEGNNTTITGLTAPLFAGGFAGGSGIVIKNLTIDKSEIVSTHTQGSGAFVENSDSQEKIYLENCHLTNSSVTGSRTGGLIGWTSGYSNTNDGAVKSYITIKNCSVKKCTITGSSVGGLNGHAGASDWTYTTIEDCEVTDCTLSSTDTGSWRVGVAVGTANAGEVTITNLTESGNTLTQTDKTAPTGEKRNYYGRFVPGTTGKLVIDGTSVSVN